MKIIFTIILLLLPICKYYNRANQTSLDLSELSIQFWVLCLALIQDKSDCHQDIILILLGTCNWPLWILFKNALRRVRSILIKTTQRSLDHLE